MLDDKVNSFEVTFKNVDFIVTLCIESEHNNEKLCVEIEEKSTSERWKGLFDSTCNFLNL